MGRPLVLNVWKQRMSWKQQMSSNSNWTLSHPRLNPCSLENYVLETLVRSTSNVWWMQCSAVQRKITSWRHWYAQPAESQTYTRPRVFGGQFGDRQICYQILWITEFVTLQQKSITVYDTFSKRTVGPQGRTALAQLSSSFETHSWVPDSCRAQLSGAQNF